VLVRVLVGEWREKTASTAVAPGGPAERLLGMWMRGKGDVLLHGAHVVSSSVVHEGGGSASV
jgi:hypothetical protein